MTEPLDTLETPWEKPAHHATDRFGQFAEHVARLMGTPHFLMWQTGLVVLWVAVNVLVIAYRWDPYPFILLNLFFSTQASYAAPLILLAQTRQAEREHSHEVQDWNNDAECLRILQRLEQELLPKE